MLCEKKTVISFLIALFILSFGIFVNKLTLSVSEITEKEKCPACFGVSICQDIDENKVSFEYTDFYSFFNNLLSVKNVYYGKYKDEKVIMKKLAHDSELETFDKMVCTNSEFLELCFNKSKVKKRKENFYKLIISELDNSKTTDPDNKLRLCPTTANIGELLSFGQIQNTVENEDYYKYLWTSIKINPEPIILQILSAKDGWPTPKYLGACGRLIIEEYIGLPLTEFTKEPWIRRAKIASSLLDAAYMFTFKNPKFAFYPTDISVDNIAINEHDKAIFVDLENIIIVDKNLSLEVSRKIKTWNETYFNNVDIHCEECFVFSPTDICNHKLSDHNYYAICQHILAQGLGTDLQVQGFLHDPPDDILKKHPTLTHLLKQCAKPDTPNLRINNGIQLKKVLDTIIKHTSIK